ncbi:hypothetical protein [Nonomuraea rubra]|uniref:hypothetical protein n=1 Tax=Nonomuraea rubra TaxID=46180 RepID=UPI0031EEA734
MVEIAPCTGSGRATGRRAHVGPAARRAEFPAHAGRLLARKYPMLHGVLVPLSAPPGPREVRRTPTSR